VFTPPSTERDTMVAARSCGRRTNGTIRCWQESLGFLGASYLKLVQGTNRFSLDPPGAYDWLTMMKGRSGVSQS
jgi:hypothetical protein